MRDTILHAALIFGLMRFGAVTMSMRSPRVPDGIAVDAVLTDMPQKFSGNATVLKVDNAWLSGDGKAPDYARIDSGNEDDICRIILTSGSTGDAKGIAFSHTAPQQEKAPGLAIRGPL